MACVDTRTAPGDIFFLETSVALVYGTTGIELRLNSRNLANVERAYKTGETIRDTDDKLRRYNVRFDKDTREIVFEPNKGEIVRTPEWILFTPEKMAA